MSTGWWTEELIGMVRDIRERGDYTLDEARDLALALHRANCPEVRIISGLRRSASDEKPNTGFRRAALIAELLGGEHAEAVLWFRQFVTEFRGYDDGEAKTFEELLADLYDFYKTGRLSYLNFETPDAAYGGSDSPMWKHFGLIMGIPPDDLPGGEKFGNRSTNPYRCAC